MGRLQRHTDGTNHDHPHNHRHDRMAAGNWAAGLPG
jgi:hypothetical protein